MINTVLGQISKEELGHTRMHEHILWGWTDDVKNQFNRNVVVKTMLPYLKELKKMGCDTLVEATTSGAGRNTDVLKELSEKSELNIITNCGVWDGLDYNQKHVPVGLKNKGWQEIADLWINEYEYGIDGSNVKPGVIKIGLGDNDKISDFQLTFLNAAINTSKQTGLPIIAHICSSESARRIVNIVKDNNLDLSKFIWSHADYAFDSDTIIELAKQGIYIELSWHTGKAKDYAWYIDIINKLIELKQVSNLLVSQDAGGFHDGNIVSYMPFYSKFIQELKVKNISLEVINRLLISNPSKVLDN